MSRAKKSQEPAGTTGNTAHQTPDRFPAELLNQSIEDRLAYFKEKMVTHPRLIAVHEKLMDAIYRPEGASIIFVIGPTGVGKSTLCQGVLRTLTREAMTELERNPGKMLAVLLEAVPPHAFKFDWNDFYSRLLEALYEVLKSVCATGAL